MTTVEKILLDVRALFDELSKNGTLLPESTVADMNLSAIRFVDMAQKELFSTGNIYKTMKITQKEPVNLLGNSEYEIRVFEGTDYTTDEKIANAYYFETDDSGIVQVQEHNSGIWQTIETINVADSDKMISYKGIITPTTAGNLIRLNFTGTTLYKFQNVALYREPFKATKIPNYKPYLEYIMPSDFRVLKEIIFEDERGGYIAVPNYKWEGFKSLYVDRNFIGNLRIIYKSVPITITNKNDVLEIDDITANAITYYVASKVAPHEMKELTNFFEEKYNELKQASKITTPASEQTIQDVYRW